MNIENYLTEHNIPFKRFEHPAVYTCEEANRLIPNLPGVSTKNLFLRDKKGSRHLLVVVSDGKSVDMVGLAELLGTSRLSMGSPERLQARLGIEPGSVSLLAVINDSDCSVEVVIDRAVWVGAALKCHPLVNTLTLVIPQDGLARFLEMTGHTPRIVDVPGAL